MYTLKLYKNVDCQRPPTENLRWFTSLAEQTRYFDSKASKTELNCYPYKDNPNVIKVGLNVDELRNYPYLSYQYISSTGVAGKRVYFFIDSVTYLNEETSNVTITMDYRQTYMFELKIGNCFVEREHVTDDTRGANIIPDKIATGEYVYGVQKYSGLFNYADYHIILATTESDTQPTYGKFYCSIYSGVNYIDFNRDFSSLNGLIDNLVSGNKKDAILGIYMCPKELINFTAIPMIKNFELPEQPNSFGGYIPKNNKLYTYPYSFVTMTNGNGQTMELKYEYLSRLQMGVEFSTGINMEAYCYPSEYLGIANNRLYKLKINNFPMCAFTVDSYQAWLAQNQGYFKQGIANTALGFALGGGVGGIAGALSSVTSAMIQNEQAKTLPEVAKGSSSGNAEFANGTMDFVSYTTTLTAQQAKSIDDYWTAFGYPVNVYKIPNINTHTMFNYVKVSDSNITGNMPADALSDFIGAFQSGIRLWHQSFVGTASYRENEVK